MGHDKYLINYHGKAQCYYVYDMAKEFCTEAFISCNTKQSPLIDNDYRTIADVEMYAHKGPATGVLSAFNNHPANDFLVIGCDYPLLIEEELRHFIENIPAESVAAAFYDASNERYVPVLAWYSSEGGSLLIKMAGDKHFSLQRFLLNVDAFKHLPLDEKSLLSVDDKEVSERVMSITNVNH